MTPPIDARTALVWWVPNLGMAGQYTWNRPCKAGLSRRKVLMHDPLSGSSSCCLLLRKNTCGHISGRAQTHQLSGWQTVCLGKAAGKRRRALGTVTSSGSCCTRKSTSSLKLLTSIHWISPMFWAHRNGVGTTVEAGLSTLHPAVAHPHLHDIAHAYRVAVRNLAVLAGQADGQQLEADPVLPDRRPRRRRRVGPAPLRAGPLAGRHVIKGDRFVVVAAAWRAAAAALRGCLRNCARTPRAQQSPAPARHAPVPLR